MFNDNSFKKVCGQIDLASKLTVIDLESKCQINDNIIKEAQQSEKLKQLGFKHTPSINKNNFIAKTDNNREKMEYLNKLELDYPESEFITINQLDKIAKKYGLFYENVSFYNRPVPSKTVDELLKITPLKNRDIVPTAYEVFNNFSHQRSEFKKFCEIKGKKKPIFTNDEVRKSHMKYRGDVPSTWLFGKPSADMVFYNELYDLGFEGLNIKVKKVIDKKGIFALAPITHFNEVKYKLFKLSFYKSLFFNIKTPIYFQFVNHDFIRIVSKWEEKGNDGKKLNIKSDII